MNRRYRRLLSSPAAPLSILLLLSGCASEDAHGDASPAAEQGKAEAAAPAPAPRTLGQHYQDAPDFNLPNVAGGTLQLSSFRGKVVLVDFWATWCGPCRAAIPHLNTLYTKHKENGFEIVGISVDQPRGGLSGAELVQRFAQSTRMEYPTVMGDAAVVSAYGGIQSIPTAFLVDQNGKIRKRYVGLQPSHVVEKAVEDLLSESASAEDESI
jgi:thiol-disulfide isomerase/thioredoxin